MTRANGRTYRKCLRAVLAASEGKEVLFIVGNNIEKIGVMNVLTQLTNGFTHHREEARFLFKNGGYISVRFVYSQLQGTKYDTIIEDELLGMAYPEIEDYLQKTRPTLLR